MMKFEDLKNIYGVIYVSRPHIKAIKKIDLTGESGKEVIKGETEKVLRIHKKTFEKLSLM